MIDAANVVRTLQGKPVAVLGLGVSNRAVIAALARAGASLSVWDDQEENRKNVTAPLRNLAEEDLSKYACLVLAPGISFDHPVAVKAGQTGIEILCDIEILHRCGHGRRTVGITGTNGKSTTTALIGHILNENGIRVAVGGNIGTPVLDLTLPPEDGVIVMELSSYQLDLCPSFAPDIAVHLNLTPDHLDRHKTLEGYAQAKKRIFRGRGKAVIGIDDEESKKIFKSVQESGARDCFPVSVRELLKSGIYVDNGTLFDAMEGKAVSVGALAIETLRGAHNHQNAACAYAAARLCGLAPEAIMAAMKSFPGLNHRQYLVRAIAGVSYVNDSKATNADAAARALAAYKNIYWIAGGQPKEGGLVGVEPYLSNVRHAFLIGQAMDDFASWLDRHGVPHSLSGTLDKALWEAHTMAQGERGKPGGAGVVLLSPACASFDQFKNFEERGNMFAALVNDLKGDAA